MSDTNVPVTSTDSTPAAATPAASAAPAATPTPAPAPQSATPAAPQAPATGAAPEGWVPSYRVRESREAGIREAQAQFARQEATLRAELSKLQTQVRGLVGVNPPADPEVSAVRERFGSLYPGLNKLEERADAIQQLLERAEDLQQSTDHYWQSYGRQTMDRLFEHAGKSLGQPLTDEGKRALHASFTGWVQSSPELSMRYASDPTIVEDYWNAFTSSFIEPARRATGAQVMNRTSTALPQDSPGGAPRSTPAPKPKDLDEASAAAWAIYNQRAKQ